MSSTSKIRDRINALKSKTTARGCTEAEAMAAADLAAKLMQEYSISEVQLKMSETRTKTSTRGRAERDKLVKIISFCTNTSAMYLTDIDTVVMFVGREPGPQIADYLRDICLRAINRDLAEFKEGRFYRSRRKLATRRAAAGDFVAGMVIRLSNRLLHLFEPLIDNNERAAAQKALVERFPGGVTVRPKAHNRRFGEAATAGWCAGNAVQLERGVGRTGKPAQIEGAMEI